MTNLEALKELYVSIGGTASDFNGVKTTAEALRLLYAQLGGSDDVSNILTIAEMIRKVATCEIGGGGSGGDGSFKVIDVSDSTTASDYNETVYRLTEAKTAEALAVEDGTRLVFTWPGFGKGKQPACFLVYATKVGSGEEGEGPGSSWLTVLEGDPRGKTTKFISNDYKTYQPK